MALQKAAEEAERAASGSPFPDQNGSVGAPNGDTGPGEGGAGLTFDDTTEFVRNISYRPAANESRRRPAPEVKREDSASTPVPDSKAARSTSAHETRFDLGPAMKEEPQEPGEVLGSVDAAELTGLDPRMKEEDDDEDEQMGELPEGGAEAAEEEVSYIFNRI